MNNRYQFPGDVKQVAARKAKEKWTREMAKSLQCTGQHTGVSPSNLFFSFLIVYASYIHFARRNLKCLDSLSVNFVLYSVWLFYRGSITTLKALESWWSQKSKSRANSTYESARRSRKYDIAMWQIWQSTVRSFVSLVIAARGYDFTSLIITPKKEVVSLRNYFTDLHRDLESL